MIDSASLFSDELTEAILDEGEITSDMIRNAVRKGTLQRGMTPLMVGSAYKNKAVQPLLDSVILYLPNPDDVPNEALDRDNNEEPVALTSDNSAPTVALPSNLKMKAYGQLTYN